MTDARDTTSKPLRELDLSDLDQVVGGATTPQTPAYDPTKDQGFLATLHNVAATVSNAAADIQANASHAAADIKTVEDAAAAGHVSTDAALAVLLSATHGNADVASELSSHLASGAGERELAALVGSGQLSATDAVHVVQGAVGALAANSPSSLSALGTTPSSALDVVEAKLDAAAHDLQSTYSDQLSHTPAQIASIQTFNFP